MHRRGYPPAGQNWSGPSPRFLALYLSEVRLTYPPHFSCACPRQRRRFPGFQGQRRRHPKHKKWPGVSLSSNCRASIISRRFKFRIARVDVRTAMMAFQDRARATRDGGGSSRAIMSRISKETRSKDSPCTTASRPPAAGTRCSTLDIMLKCSARTIQVMGVARGRDRGLKTLWCAFIRPGEG